MADDKRGREKQAADEQRRQRERELQEARDRANEAEPPRDDPDDELGDIDDALETLDYPTTTEDVIEAFGDREVQSRGGWTSIAAVLDPVGDETYHSADEVRTHIQERLDRG